MVQNVGKGFAQHFAGGLEKGKGSAKGSGLEKGKGKGKARAKPKPQPLEDADEEPMDLATALKKAKKTRDMLTSTSSNFEKALKKVDKSPYLSKQSFKDKQGVLDGLHEMVKKTKKLLKKEKRTKWRF